MTDMKKSEALKILGLVDGVADDEVKRAHRALVIAHHPDKFALDSSARSEAEELTKQINEARDVLLNRTWSPEFDPRRDPRPYANPYAHPTSNPFGGTPQPGASGQSEQNPFAGGPFGQGQSSYVWTSWDAARTGENPGGYQPFDFDPFAPFWAAEPQKTPHELLVEAQDALKREAGIVAAKLALLVVLSLVGSLATGLFLYVIISIVYGLWKRFGSCLIVLVLPLALVLAPIIFILAPREGAVTIGLGVVFLIAVLFDIVNMRDLIRTYRAARQASVS